LHYCLQLANGYRFYFTGIKETESWLKKLAYVMQLTPSIPEPKFPRIISIPRNMIETDPTHSLSYELRVSLPASGWRLQDYNPPKFWSHPDTPDIIYGIINEKDYIVEVIDMDRVTSLIFRWMLGSGCLPLHSALIEKNGVGVALCGRGGIGKSTCCKRVSSPWRTLCDDTVLVVPDLQDRYMAHPFPTWSDYIVRQQENTWNVQQYVPLRAIFFLERSPDGESDEVIPIDQGRASLYINHSSNQILGRSFNVVVNEEDQPAEKNRTAKEHLPAKKRLFDNSCQLGKAVPAFKLKVSLNGNFWEVIEKSIKNGSNR